jgi:hypothetical protein
MKIVLLVLAVLFLDSLPVLAGLQAQSSRITVIALLQIGCLSACRIATADEGVSVLGESVKHILELWPVWAQQGSVSIAAIKLNITE